MAATPAVHTGEEKPKSDNLDLKAQGPYDSQHTGQQIDASVLISEALDHLTADQIAAMTSDELGEAAMSWIDSGAAEKFLPEIPWNVTDDRFSHARSVVDVVIDAVQFDEAHGSHIELTVDLRETEEGFQGRLDAESASAGSSRSPE